jgi:hypothetical protein
MDGGRNLRRHERGGHWVRLERNELVKFILI